MHLPNSVILRNLRLQKAIISVIIVTVVSVMLGVILPDFYTKGEPREALVAKHMIESGRCVLATMYGDEFAYKPPLFHWIITGFSKVSGSVTEVSSRLPSAVSLLVLALSFFVFTANRLRFRQSYIAIFLLLTSFEVHRAAITARVDMLLTCFIVLTLLVLYKWEDEEHLSGLPPLLPILITGGILTKGPVALVLPVGVFFFYLLLLDRYPLGKIVRNLFVLSVVSLLVPLVWYYSAWRIGGEAFKEIVLAENLSRFLHISTDNLPYDLGHEKPFFYPLLYILTGFFPWILLLPFIPKRSHLYKRRSTGIKSISNTLFKRFDGMPKFHLFSWVVIVVTLLFYMIPVSKRSVYLLPIYPFLCVIFSYYLLKMQRHGRNSLRIFSLLIGMLVSLFLLGILTVLLTKTTTVASFFSFSPRTASLLSDIRESLHVYLPLTILLGTLLLGATITAFYQAKRRNYTKLIMTNIAIVLFCHMLIDGPLLSQYKSNNSAHAFAQTVDAHASSQADPIYVINNLRRGYRNLYGLAFYAHRPTPGFISCRPSQGHLILWESDLPKLEEDYGHTYVFEEIARDTHPIKEANSTQLLLQFQRK